MAGISKEVENQNFVLQELICNVVRKQFAGEISKTSISRELDNDRPTQETD